MFDRIYAIGLSYYYEGMRVKLESKQYMSNGEVRSYRLRRQTKGGHDDNRTRPIYIFNWELDKLKETR